MFRIIESIVDELFKKALKNFIGERYEVHKENNAAGPVVDENVSIVNNNRVNIIEPTEEQIKVVKAVESIDMISINAFAGTGKTTTLGLIVEQYKNRKIMVLAFNRAMAEELKEKFSKFGNVEVYTTHSLAYRHVRKILGIQKIEDERALLKFI